MNPSQKLLIAASLLAAGYAVATFVSSPDAPYLPRVDNWLSGAAADTSGHAQSGGASLVGSVRLLPDSTAGRATQLPQEPRSVDASREVASIASTEDSESFGTQLVPGGAPVWIRPAPRARLTDVSLPPRGEENTRQAVEGGPHNDSMGDGQERDQFGRLAGGASVDPWAIVAGYGSDGRRDTSPVGEFAGRNAAPRTPIESTFNVAPTEPSDPPAARIVEFGSGRAPGATPIWPEAEPAGGKIHVVVDGDSLARLASRYLGDAARAEEIFALNREQLASPELLPIGAELQIPARDGAWPGEPSMAGTLPRGDRSVELAAATVSSGGAMVPVRPIPTALPGTPRAELLRPMPAGWQQHSSPGSGVAAEL